MKEVVSIQFINSNRLYYFDGNDIELYNNDKVIVETEKGLQYGIVVNSNLEISERHNHSKLTSYLPGGKDATVVWGLYDFKFINNRNYPIKIDMSVQGGIITAEILGIKENDEYLLSYLIKKEELYP